MTFYDIRNEAKGVFKMFFPSHDTKEMLSNEESPEEKYNKLLFAPSFLNKLGFPFNINDGSIESASISLKNYIFNKKPIEIDLNNVNITCYPSKTLVRDKSFSILQRPVTITINNFRLTIILTEKNADYILITAKNIIITISPEQGHKVSVIGLKIFYLYSSILNDINIDFIIKKNSQQTIISAELDVLSTNVSSKQFSILTNLYSAIFSSTESNIFEFNIKTFKGYISDGTFAEFNCIKYSSGTNFYLSIEKCTFIIEKITFVINGLEINGNEIKIQSIDNIDTGEFKLTTNCKTFISTTANVITISDILIESKPEFFVNYLNLLKRNVFIQFLKNNWRGDPPPKILFNSIKLIFGSFELNMSITVNSSMKISQINYTQVSLASGHDNVIFNDLIIQIVQMVKNDRDYLSLFLGLVPIQISFEELTQILPILKIIFKLYEPEKRKLPPIYDINIPKIEGSIGRRVANKFIPIFNAGLSATTIKGTPIKDETRYKTNVRASLKYFHDGSGVWVSILNKMLVNLDILDSIKYTNFSLDFPDPIQLNLTKRAIDLIKNYQQIKDNISKDTVKFVNNTRTPFVFFTESSKFSLSPNEEVSISDTSIKFSEESFFVSTRSLFNGMKVNERLLKINSDQISIEYQQSIQNCLPQSIMVFKISSDKPHQITTLGPSEIAEFKEDFTGQYLIACSKPCAMASTPTSFENTSLIQVILDGIQKACVVSKIDQTIYIRPYIRIKNEMHFKLVAKLSLVDIIETVALDALGEAEIAMPFYPSIRTNFQLSYDEKIFCTPIDISATGTGEIELPNDIILPFQTSISYNNFEQLVLKIKSQSTLINRSSADITIHTKENEIDINAEPEEQPIAPLFVQEKRNGIDISSDFEISIGSTTTKEKFSKNGLLNLQLKTNSSLFYPISLFQNDNTFIIKDGIWFENKLRLKVTVVINSVIFLEFGPGEAGAIPVKSADGSAALSIENYNDVRFPMTNYASSTVEFSSEDGNSILADITIDKGDKAEFEIVLSSIDLKKPRFAIINDCNDQIVFKQHSADITHIVEPHSMRPFGFASLVEIPILDIEYKQAKVAIDITQTGIYDACVFKYRTSVLENGTHALHINPSNNIEKLVNANISLPNLILTYYDDTKESLKLTVDGIKIAIGTKEFYRLLQIGVDSFKLADMSEGPNYLLESARIEGHQSILIKAAFNDYLQLSALTHLNVSIQELAAFKEFDISLISQLIPSIRQIPIVADDITFNPIVSNIFSFGSRFIFPAISAHNICWSVGGISNYISQFYSEKWRFFTFGKTIIPAVSSPISYVKTVLPGFYVPGAPSGRLVLAVGERPHMQPIILPGAEFVLQIAEGRSERTPIQRRATIPPRAGTKLIFGAPLPSTGSEFCDALCSLEAGKRCVITFSEKLMGISTGKSVHSVPYFDISVNSINGNLIDLKILDECFTYQMENNESAEFAANLILTMRGF